MERLLSSSEQLRQPLVAQGQVNREPDGFRLELSIWQADRPMQRSMRAASCSELASAAALILALVVDPGLAVPPSEPEVAGPPATLPDAVRPAPEPARRSGPVVSWGAFGGMSVDSGALPAVAPGLTVGVLGEIERLRLRVGGVWFPLSKQYVAHAPSEPQTGGKFSLLAAQARGCYRFLDQPALGACGAAEVGSLHALGFGTADDRARATLWAALGPGLEAALGLGRAATLAAGVDMLFPLNRPHFELENIGAVYRPNEWSLRATLAGLLHFQ
jgi:hypothetical protein